MKKITNMLKDVVTKAQEAKNSGMSAQVMPDSGVPMEEGEVNITSNPKNMPGAGSGVIGKVLSKNNDSIRGITDKIRNAAQAKNPSATMPRSRGGFSGVINKARDAIQAAKASKKPFKSGGSVKSGASKRGDGCATKGKTKGRMI
jgi:hypothetical protein